jgi:PAS domain S-box-containing protein
MKILIADDSPIFRRLVEATLAKRGYETTTVSNGAEALEALQQPGAPPLVILDVNMPGVDGIEVCRRLRKSPQSLPAYIILLTANDSKSDLVAGLEGGADDYIVKPFDVEELCARVKVGLRIVELQRRMSEHVKLLEDAYLGLKLKSEALTRVDEKLTRGANERKQVEEALKLSEERYRAILEEMADGYWETDLSGNFTFLNTPVVRSYGRSREELLGLNIKQHMDKETASRVHKAFNQIFQTSEPAVGLFYETTRGDGASYYAESNVSLVRDAEGRPAGFRGIARDVTERRRAEEAIRLSEERYRTIIEEMDDSYWETDLSGNLTFFNNQVVSQFGRSREELLGLNNREYMNEKTARRVGKVFKQIYLTGEPVRGFAYEMTRGDGTSYYAESNISLIRDAEGKPAGFRGISRDVTARRRAEEAIRRSEEKYRSLIANIPDVTWTADSQGSISFISPNVERVTGFTSEEICRKSRSHWIDRIHTDDLKMVQEAIDGLFFRDSSYDVTYRVRRRNGEWAWLHDRSITTYEKNGLRCADGIMSDITERRRVEEELRQSEEQLRRSQKLQSIGQLAAGVAHEINTPMQYLGDNLRFLQDSSGDRTRALEIYGKLLSACRDEGLLPELVAEVESAIAAADVEYLAVEIPRALQQSLEGVQHVSKIVQSMKDFAHPGQEKKEADLNKAIESTLTVARSEWKYVADLVTEFDPSLPLVPCLLTEFNQVILNMVINASHAISDKVGDGSQGKGTIAVSTRRAGDYAEVRIADTGTGIPEKIRGRIFDPFFTTKEVGRGTGQGLAISHSVIVEKHGGTIEFETEEGSGATFIIRLPLSENNCTIAANSGGHLT